MSTSAHFSGVPLAPSNPIFGLARTCKEDKNPNKCDLVVGAYRCNDGKEYVLECVRQAERHIEQNQHNHEYLPLSGHAEFNRLSRRMLFGDGESALSNNPRIQTTQALSGTGSLRLAGEFCRKFMPNAAVYIPETTWENHWKMFEACSLKTKKYGYLDSTGYGFDCSKMLEDMSEAPEGSIMLLHQVGHNPTGVDPSQEQWKKILEVVLRRKHFVIMDNAYQGFVSGDHNVDAYAARLFAGTPGVDMFVACSFAKNFGLYGQRIGAVHVVAQTEESAKATLSQLLLISRALYSNCPSHGARIVAHILGNHELYTLWKQECKAMADRINLMRSSLVEALKKHNVKGNWDHIMKQKGMFSFSGILSENVLKLRKHSIYMLENGRISLAGLNSGNIDYFASCCAKVLGVNDLPGPVVSPVGAAVPIVAGSLPVTVDPSLSSECEEQRSVSLAATASA